MNLLLTSIKIEYPDVLNGYRIMGANKSPSTMVRLDIQNISIIDKLLSKTCIYHEHLRLATTKYLAPVKVLVCTKCFEIGLFRSSCKRDLDYCRRCGMGVTDIKQHVQTCTNPVCCIRCQGLHDANDSRCPIIKSHRSTLTKSRLLTTATPNHHHLQTRAAYHHNDTDYPILKESSNKNWNYTNNILINTGKRLDELSTKMKHFDNNMNGLMNLNNKQLQQITAIHQMTTKHEHQLQIQQSDITFQHDFMSQCISPICQLLVDIVPVLVKQNTIKDNTLLCPSLLAVCEKFATDLPTWTNRFVQNENLKMKLINEFNMKNQVFLPPSNNNNNINIEQRTTSK
ncbi:unnamed protein product [Rotaria magnacalcarata]|uniref:Uncharacterized protein n=1 Tax=Rotaria magnacalcarata TaxID=392030 RepID=A0A816RJ98_9BILA|nr:unnamed protein product [Rotaria magnacalcarata]